MSCKVVIDTNILVSSLLSRNENSATVKVVEKIFTGEIVPLFSQEIFNEYNEVLRRKKFNFSKKFINSFLQAIKEVGINIQPTPSHETLIDMKDLPFYEVVIEKSNENAFLVTGNIKHFPDKDFIVTPNKLLEILENRKF